MGKICKKLLIHKMTNFRIEKEQRLLEANNDKWIITYDDLFNWSISIIGPKDTPYANEKFELKVAFSEDYPFKPPRIKWLTPIEHPNINPPGCLHFQKYLNWNPGYNIEIILNEIIETLGNPSANKK